MFFINKKILILFFLTSQLIYCAEKTDIKQTSDKIFIIKDHLEIKYSFDFKSQLFFFQLFFKNSKITFTFQDSKCYSDFIKKMEVIIKKHEIDFKNKENIQKTIIITIKENLIKLYDEIVKEDEFYSIEEEEGIDIN